MVITESLKSGNEPLYFFGLLSLLGAFVTFILSLITETKVNGINAFVKPMKFFISTFFFVWTLGYYCLFLHHQQAVQIFSWITIIGLGYELIAITFQAAFGKLSHYNTSTPFDAAILFLMVLAIVTVMLAASFIGILFFFQVDFDANPVVVWSIRLSLILTVVFAFEGFVMGYKSGHTIGASDDTVGLPVVNWSKNHGDLRIAHFLGLHAIQVVPLLSYFLAKDEITVFIIAALYLALTTFTLIRALKGKPLLGLKRKR